MKATGVRKSLYLSKSKDKDIINYIDSLTATQDFSTIARGLIRDGIKYRDGDGAIDTEPRKELIRTSEPNVILSHTLPLSSSLDNIVLTKKQVTNEDLEDRLDSF